MSDKIATAARPQLRTSVKHLFVRGADRFLAQLPSSVSQQNRTVRLRAPSPQRLFGARRACIWAQRIDKHTSLARARRVARAAQQRRRLQRVSLFVIS